MDEITTRVALVYRRFLAAPSHLGRELCSGVLGSLAVVALLTSTGCGKPSTSETATAENQAATAGETPSTTTDDPPKAPSAKPSVAAEGALVREPSLDIQEEPDPAAKPEPPQKLPPPKDSKRLSPDFDIWVDVKNKQVIIDGLVSQRQAVLEMFACTPNTKEHESIIQANTQAFLAHTGLLAVGAEPGHPVRWDPKYEPPTGTEIEIELQWRDKAGKLQKSPAQRWVRNADTGKEMSEPWVFGGSGLWKDDETGKEYYMAEGGDFICVSNFGSAMLDVPVPSTQANDGLLYEAFTERIPPLGTPVRMILRPKLDEKASAEDR